MGHCLWLGPKPVSVQSLVDWEFVTFKIFAGNIDEMSVVTKKKKQSQIALGWLSLYRSTNAPGGFFSVAVISEVGDVACTLFWTDCWLHGQRICGLVPQLFTLVAYRRSNKRTVLGGGSYHN
jgi:hypothetical protein